MDREYDTYRMNTRVPRQAPSKQKEKKQMILSISSEGAVQQ